MPHSLRITVIGPISGGSASVAECATRALCRLGHTVTFVDNRRFEPEMTGIRRSRAPIRTRDDQMYELLVRAAAATRNAVIASRPGLALYLAQAPIVSDQDTAELRLCNIPTVFWFVEDHRVFPYWRNAIGYFDHFWTIQQGDFPSELSRLGQRFVDYVPLACDPEIHYPHPASETARYRADVAFAGTAFPNRVRFLAALADVEPQLYGTGWTGEQTLSPLVAHDGELPHAELARIFSAALISLNLSSSLATADDGRKDVVNPRAFEICGCGGFQLADAAIPLESFFEPGREVVTFSSVAEARDLIRYYLRHDSERIAIAGRGMARAHSEHTYDRRLRPALERVFDRY
jgi:spore maturation protein CgeB